MRMVDSAQLIEQFNQSPAGRVINGREAFRNRMGRLLHGVAHKHSKLALTIGIAAAVGGFALGGPIGFAATFPVMFQGIYGTVAPKKFEKAACDFLMNQGIRKAAALASFMKKQNVPVAEQETTLQTYIRQQAPLGCFKDYDKQFPDAAKQILSAGTKGDLPLLHGPELYHDEIVQEMLTKNRQKGGILRGMLRTFLPSTQHLEKQAKLLAARRWADRQEWEKLPPENREPWRSFYKAREFERSQQATTSALPIRPQHGLKDRLKPISMQQAQQTVQPVMQPSHTHTTESLDLRLVAQSRKSH